MGADFKLRDLADCPVLGARRDGAYQGRKDAMTDIGIDFRANMIDGYSSWGTAMGAGHALPHWSARTDGRHLHPTSAPFRDPKTHSW